MENKTDAEIMEGVKKAREKKEEPKKRQIIIETDGSEIQIIKAEVAGALEMEAIFNSVLGYIKNLPKENNKK